MENMKTIKTEQNSPDPEIASILQKPGEEPGGEPILFKKGLPGLGKSRRFILQGIEDNPYFYYLRSLEDEEVGLILVDPFPCFPGYGFELPKTEQKELELEQKEDVLVFTTVTVLGENKMTVNLAAPIIINAKRKVAKQLILSERIEQMRTPLPLS